VLALTDKEDWVLDPFAGVGSAVIAALIHQRRAMGCEKEPEYIKAAKKRIQDYAEGTLQIRPLGKPIHKPNGTEKICQAPPEWNSWSGNRPDKELC
jgi:DNA modification methylase